MMSIPFSRFTCGALLVAGAASCTPMHPAAEPPLDPSNPRFDWFEYAGNDSITTCSSASGSASNAVCSRTTAQNTATQYANPILAGFYPDPSAIRVGEDFYLVTSSFAYFPGVPIFHSKDLVNWTQIGSVLTRRSQLNLDSAGISRGTFAPVIREHAGTFYMITTLVDRGGNFFVTATNPAGPWSDPVWLPSVDGIDPSFFFDDNGKAYVINNGPPIEKPRYNGHRAIWIQEFDVASQKMVGPRKVIVNGGVDLSKNPIWIEAPHILEHDGSYYLICAEGGTAYEHSEVVFRGDAPMGTFTPGPNNPILTQRHLDRARVSPITTTGHADFVDTPNGEWWAVFLGVRPYGDDLFNTGRETFLMPVRWVSGWPVITEGTQQVSYLHTRPALPPQPPPPIPTNGNFTVRDDFNERALPMYWEAIRGPADAFVDLKSEPGTLTMRARPNTFEPAAQPSFIGRRQQHTNAVVTTAMRYIPGRNGDKAGIVAFQNENFYYFLGVSMMRGGYVVRVEKHAKAPFDINGELYSQRSIVLTPGEAVFLRIQAKGDTYSFAYGTKPDEWHSIAATADGTILSTRIAGGFVGSMFGLYAYSAPAVQ